ncbi:hypothetical protein HK100_012004 [Physocladia obscura]|uniref:NADP-dependent oxidoreductase domain-containing protein n=1 Tax=Physocladia obscura TaxID=109957 RepID=A0AAD5T979_9FUNG|nr:hypothetical protein HK100_012004 [Physocladia obscura]
MSQTHLGRNGPLVSALGLGAMGMSEFYGKPDDIESLATLKHAIDIGCTFWDTSDMYGIGHNEELIGKALKEYGREKVFICTKFGIKRDNATKALIGLDSSPDYVQQACNASLQRLGIQTIDLYYQHRVDPKTPIEDTVRAMAELVKEGKVRYLGLSEASAETIRRAHKIHPITAYQVEYSPWTTDIESNGILDTCNELGIAIIAYSPLGRGFLTGRFKSPEDFEVGDYRHGNPRFQGEAFTKNLAIVTALSDLAAKKGVSVTQLTLAWVIAQGPNIIPIPGTKKSERLDENFGALHVVVTDEEKQLIRKIINEIPVVGTRYDANGMRTVNV